MFPGVTAILVVRHGSERLDRTLEAIRTQDRGPGRLAVVLTHADAEAVAAIDAIRPDVVVRLEQAVPFGAAVRAAELGLPEPSGDGEVLWLLADDTAPAPGALTALMGVLEVSRSVAIAGPKLLRSDEPDRFAVFGRSMSRLGRSLPVVADELDQGQHDDLSDVLAVEAAGLVVRREVWRQLDGFDPALAYVDDGLDLGVRARLAGHRVVVAPGARVLAGETGETGVVAAARAARARDIRRLRRRSRTEQLHRRLTYAPAVAVPLHWLAILPLALLRSVRSLLLKAPGSIPGELAAAVSAMASVRSLARSRQVLKRAKTARWSTLAPLRIQPDELRRRRGIEAEARRERARGRVHELQFLGTGGGWVLLASAAASVSLFSWALTARGLEGGGLLPLSERVADLWRNAGYGWRDLGVGFVGAADPFAGVLAVLGSAAFWAPSAAILALWLLAIPLSALGAWLAASRLTASGPLRALVALVYAFSPTLLSSLSEGRPGAVLAHVLLGWLAFAVFGAATSWAAAATSSLLFAAVVAAAPSLAPALLVGWLVALAVSGRAAVRLALLPLPALVLAAPLIASQIRRGTPLALVADPGAPVPAPVPSPAALAVGQPGGGTGGWDAFLGGLVAQVVDPRLLLALLLLPLAIAAVAVVATRRVLAGALALGTGLLGYATAAAATHVAVATRGPDAVPVWSGPGLSLAWLGLALAIGIALGALPRGRAALATVLGLCALAAVVPAAAGLALGRVAVSPASERTLPAFVGAEAEVDPRVTTLRLEPEPGGGIRSTLERGTGTTLDAQSTFAATDPELGPREAELAEVAGNLVSRSGFDATEAVEGYGISYVLLAEPSDASADDGRALATVDRARVALDGNPALTPVGETEFGTLWRFVDAQADAAAARIPDGAGGPLGLAVNLTQLIVILATLLLSIPTGAGREADRRPVQRVRRARRARARKARQRDLLGQPAAAGSDAAADDVEADAAASGEEVGDPRTVDGDASDPADLPEEELEIEARATTAGVEPAPGTPPPDDEDEPAPSSDRRVAERDGDVGAGRDGGASERTPERDGEPVRDAAPARAADSAPVRAGGTTEDERG